MLVRFDRNGRELRGGASFVGIKQVDGRILIAGIGDGQHRAPVRCDIHKQAAGFNKRRRRNSDFTDRRAVLLPVDDCQTGELCAGAERFAGGVSKNSICSSAL